MSIWDALSSGFDLGRSVWKRYRTRKSKMIKRRRTVVSSHWAKLIEDFNTSPLEFYEKVQQALARREVPGLTSGLVEWSEGGSLSAKRTYLRLVRERLIIDVCAAPFGTGFFFSWRLGEVPLKFSWWVILLVLFALQWVWGGLVYLVDDVFWGTSLFLLLTLGVLICMKTVVRRNLADMDAAILKLPLISMLYERYLRKLTYFRIDTMLMYEQAVHAAVMEVVDEVTSIQGVSPLAGDDRKPVMRDIYGRS